MSTKMWNWGDVDNGHDPIVECIGEIHQPAITIDNRSGDDLTIPFQPTRPTDRSPQVMQAISVRTGPR